LRAARLRSQASYGGFESAEARSAKAEAKQSRATRSEPIALDCFVAAARLLVMTLIDQELKMHSPILAPLIALVLWSFVMWAWLYATRIPAIVKLKIVHDPHRPNEEFHARLPAQVRWKADNYNHLMEQPTLFYAVALTLALIGEGTGLNVGIAWIYVALRIVHSLVQATVNIVVLRFAIFMAASLALLAMAVRAALALL
jgi:hypothetical protein